ncbi:Glycosyl hydrolase family 100 - like 7 [Theobroma cacao]|nr:Glycosyl hydrolase family 100 - like 7 [Theobroma cacao]
MCPLGIDVSQTGNVKTLESAGTIFEIEDSDILRISERPRAINVERNRSFEERPSSELSITSPRHSLKILTDHLEGLSPHGRRSGFNTPRSYTYFEAHAMVAEAWENLRRSIVFYRRQPVGTIAAIDHSVEELNYDQVFVRDFVPSALAFLMNGEEEIVKNFLLKTLHLQSWEKRIDRFKLGEGVMPASFKVIHNPVRNSEILMADFGESAIGRVAPVDSGFWWIILLRAYTKHTGDSSLAEMPDCQRGMRLILSLCLSEGFDTFPTLLCADGCCMIDRRMIQALFFMALRCALLLLKPDQEGKEFMERIVKRLHALSYHMRSYFWLDLKQLNDIYRYKTEEYSHTAVNKFNVMPDSLPDWVFDFMPIRGGYFIGNVSPAKMDFRWFCLGNCVAILSSLATPEQAAAIMDLIESRWEELVGEMPLKICYPALESHEWRIVTGCDPKNTRWSYHNGGSWPVLLWLLTAACIKTGRPQIARRAIELAETRLSKDHWPEYYDGKLGRYIGKQARKFQTWSIAGYLVAKMMLEDPSHLGMISLEEDKQMKPLMKRSTSWTC